MTIDAKALLEGTCCAHEPYQGKCAHCGIAFKDGLPVNSDLARDNIRLTQELAELRKVLEPFAAMGRVMETRAKITFGKTPPDSEVVCESSGEAGLGILTMGHFRDAAALLPEAPGWGGVYVRPFDRALLKDSTQ